MSSEYIRLEYLDPRTNTYLPMTYDSMREFNGFTSGFSATESISGGTQTLKMRIYNEGVPDELGFFMLKIDFSESFLRDPKTGASYDNLDDRSVRSAVTATVKTGPANQDAFRHSFEITSDRQALNDPSVIAVVFARNQKIISNPTLPTKVAVVPYMPRKPRVDPTTGEVIEGSGEYVPLEVSLHLAAEYVDYLVPKEVSVVLPESFAEFNASTASFQSKVYTMTEYAGASTQGEYLKAFYPRHLGHYFNNSSFTQDPLDANKIVFPMSLHSLQAYANNSSKYGQDEFKVGNHIFERVYDDAPTHALPLTVSLDATETVLGAAGVEFLGYSEQRSITDAMFELLGFAKYIYGLFRASRESGVTDVTLVEKMERLRQCLHHFTDSETLLETTNYSTMEGSELSSSDNYYAQVFFRSVLMLIDWMRLELGLSVPPISDNYPEEPPHPYLHVFTHVYCENCDDVSHEDFVEEPIYNFPLSQDVLAEDFDNGAPIIGVAFALYELLTLIDVTYDHTIKYSGDPTDYSLQEDDLTGKGLLHIIMSLYDRLAEGLNNTLYNSYIFNPDLESDGSELFVPVDHLPFISLYMAAADQALGTRLTLCRQPWHTLLKHFRLRGIRTQSITVLPLGIHPRLSGGSNEGTDMLTFLRLLSDIDIMPMMLYTIVDNLYSKQKSTTLSFKISVTTH